MREPWFHIVEVLDGHGRSIADITFDVARQHNVALGEIRGGRRNKSVQRARLAAILLLKTERPDLSSGTLANYFRCEPSTIRHAWRREAA